MSANAMEVLKILSARKKLKKFVKFLFAVNLKDFYINCLVLEKMFTD